VEPKVSYFGFTFFKKVKWSQTYLDIFALLFQKDRKVEIWFYLFQKDRKVEFWFYLFQKGKVNYMN
jgi:hypothetical protein